MPRRFEDRLNDLKRLPALEPPAHLEAPALAAMAKASASHWMRPLALAAGWIAAIGVGALLAVLVVSPDQAGDSKLQSAATEAPSAATEPPSAATEEAYLELRERSEYLEGVLAQLPQRQVMRVSTAGTIVGLEERIALIDGALSRQESEAAPPGYRLALMRDRVETMSALVSVRYAQSRAFSY